MARDYQAYSNWTFATFGVSPRTRSRLRNSFPNITPAEVDSFLIPNGGGENARLDRKQIRDIRTALSMYSDARMVYDRGRQQAESSRAFRASSFDPGSPLHDDYVHVTDYMDSPTIGDLYYDEFEVSPEWEGFSAAAIYSALRAWIESDQTDLEWVEFDDQDKFRY